MANAFDVSNASVGVPTKIIVGDTVTWRVSIDTSDYPTADYTVSYSFQCAEHPAGTKHSLEVTGSEDADGYYVTLTAASTLSIDHFGEWHYQAYITRDSDGARHTFDQGDTWFVSDLASLDDDIRSHAEIMLNKIETLLEGRADSDIASYSIAGRSLTKMSPKQLMEWRDHYKAEVAREKIKQDIEAGRGGKSSIKIRFTGGA